MSATETADDVSQLNLLRIFYFVVAGLQALGGCAASLYIGLGAMMLGGGMNNGASKPPPELGAMFIGLGVVAMLVIWTFSFLTYLAGKKLGERRSYTYVFVIAVLLCFSVPIGTLLGVFTIVVLLRPQVKASFERNQGVAA